MQRGGRGDADAAARTASEQMDTERPHPALLQGTHLPRATSAAQQGSHTETQPGDQAGLFLSDQNKTRSDQELLMKQLICACSARRGERQTWEAGAVHAVSGCREDPQLPCQPCCLLAGGFPAKKQSAASLLQQRCGEGGSVILVGNGQCPVGSTLMAGSIAAAVGSVCKEDPHLGGTQRGSGNP